MYNHLHLGFQVKMLRNIYNFYFLHYFVYFSISFVTIPYINEKFSNNKCIIVVRQLFNYRI